MSGTEATQSTKKKPGPKRSQNRILGDQVGLNVRQIRLLGGAKRLLAATPEMREILIQSAKSPFTKPPNESPKERVPIATPERREENGQIRNRWERKRRNDPNQIACTVCYALYTQQCIDHRGIYCKHHKVRDEWTWIYDRYDRVQPVRGGYFRLKANREW